MRILQIVHGFPSESNAGTERYCEAVCALLRARGHTVAIFAGTGQLAAKATTVTTEQDGHDVTRYYRADGRDYGWMDGYDPEVERVLRSTLTSFRPDIVHVHHWHRLTNNLVAICADLGIPVVVTLHDVWTSCPRIHRIHREGLLCREPLLTAPCLHCVERTQWQTDDEVAAALALRQQMIGEELALASALIVPSEAHRSLLLQLLALPENRLTVLPHGSLQTLMAQERRTGLSAFPNRPLQIGHWGYFLYHKGTHLLLEALHHLDDPSAVQVHLIGTALEQAYGDRLRDLARGLSVQFHGAYQPADLQAVDLDLAVFPSITSESYSFTIDEALQLGLPTLVSDRGALSERIGKAGLTFRAGDAEDLARRLQGILDAPETLEAMRLDIGSETLLSMEAHVAALEKIYGDTTQTSQPKVGTSVPYLKLLVHAQQQVREREKTLVLSQSPLAQAEQQEARAVSAETAAALAQEREAQAQARLLVQHRQIQEIEQAIGTLMADRDGQITALTQAVADRDGQITDLTQAVADRDGQILFLKQELAQVYGSRSWTFTRPLRAFRYYWNLAARKVVGAVTFLSTVLQRREQPLFEVENEIVEIFAATESSSSSKYPELASTKGRSCFPDNFTPSERFENVHASFRPKVTVIVPNYNHAGFLKQRLESIYNQTYRNFNVILLDDSSSDWSREILRDYAITYGDNTTLCFNDKNSGRVFDQWKKGFEMADGDLVWIAESDDFCETTFLEKLVPLFADEAVQLAYARSVFVDGYGKATAFTFHDYVCDIDKDKWQSDYIVASHSEVATALGLKNTIPNVSSVVFRRPVSCALLDDENWRNLKICGDWIFYLHIIRGGKIAFTNSTVNYYRFHNANSSAGTYRNDTYYKEHEAVARTIVELYNVSDDVIRRHHAFVERFWQDTFSQPGQPLPLELYDKERVLGYKSARRPNILMAGYSFSTGGGEIVPIRLANGLKKRGYAVTFFNYNRESLNLKIRQLLYSDIPVFECNSRIGSVDQLIRAFGIELIHSHHASAEHFFATNIVHMKYRTGHIATMHGMYEILSDGEIEHALGAIVNSVDLWCYIADKNLTVFKRKGYYRPERFVKIGNGLEPTAIRIIDRSTLGISSDAFVLCLASRAISEKGWHEAIKIVCTARELSGKAIHLLLLGDGPVASALRSEGVPDFVHLLGFADNPVDYFAMSDLGFLPSQFRGECVPLSVIECLCAGKPVVASDIGEIRAMLTTRNGVAGALITLQDWKVPISESASIIADFASDHLRYQYARSAAKEAAERFRMDSVLSDHENAYRLVMNYMEREAVFK